MMFAKECVSRAGGSYVIVLAGLFWGGGGERRNRGIDVTHDRGLSSKGTGQPGKAPEADAFL